MSKPFTAGQGLAKVVHDEARRILLRNMSGAVDELDKLYAQDAVKLKAGLRRLFRLYGLPQRQAAKLVDEVFTASRADRVAVIEKSIVKAARDAAGVDKRTFQMVFGGEKDTPKPKGRSGSRPSGTPLPRQADESEDEPA